MLCNYIELLFLFNIYSILYTHDIIKAINYLYITKQIIEILQKA